MQSQVASSQACGNPRSPAELFSSLGWASQVPAPHVRLKILLSVGQPVFLALPFTQEVWKLFPALLH